MSPKHVMLRLHVYYLILMSGGGGDGGGDKATRQPMTTVQECVSTFVSVKPQDMFQRDSV